MATVNLLGALALDDTAAATRDAVLDLTGAHDTPALAAQPGIATLAVRRDADSIPTADGDLSMLAVDEEGRLKTSGKTASFPVVTGALTTVAQTVTADVSRASNVVFHVKNTGAATMSVGTFVFEASIDSTNGVDGTWFSIRAVRSNANTIDNQSGTLGLVAGAGLTYSWEASVNAYQWMRLRCSVATTASSIATWTILRGSYATEPIPAAQASATQPVSGTVTVSGNVVAAPTSGFVYALTTAATTNAVIARNVIASLYVITASNPTTTAAYLKLYSKATAPTVGTDAPLITLPIPAGTTQTLNLGAIGQRFGLGIALAVTGGMAATDTTASVAGVQIAATYV